MAHARETIRAAVVTAIDAIAGLTVLESDEEIGDAGTEIPCAWIEQEAEAIEYFGGDQADPTDRLVLCELELIIAFAETTQALQSALEESIEEALAGMTGSWHDMRISSPDFDHQIPGKALYSTGLSVMFQYATREKSRDTFV